MAKTAHAPPTANRVAGGRIAVTGLAAALLAASANSGIYLAAKALGAIPATVLIPSSGEPLSLGPVVFITASSMLAGTAALLVLTRSSRDPGRRCRWLATMVLLVSVATPFTLTDAPASMITVLLLMHLTTWAVAIRLLAPPGAADAD